MKNDELQSRPASPMSLRPALYGAATGAIFGGSLAFVSADGFGRPLAGPSALEGALAAATVAIVAAGLAALLAHLLLPREHALVRLRALVASLLALLLATVAREVGVQWIDLSILGGGPWGELVAIVWPTSLVISLTAALAPIQRSSEPSTDAPDA
jgi:hypothetical protein